MCVDKNMVDAHVSGREVFLIMCAFDCMGSEER